MSQEDPTAAAAQLAADAGELDALHLIDAADKSIALKHWEQAADEYAQALDQLREQHQEDAPQLAPILHRYGRSLLEHVIATSGTLGSCGGQQDAPMPSRKRARKEANAQTSTSASGSKPPSDPHFSFSGDVDDDDEEQQKEEEEGVGAANGALDEEDTDDLSVAFSVLDLARLIYHKLLNSSISEGAAKESDIVGAGSTAQLTTLHGQQWNFIRIKNELAEVLNDLGDVGLESENFQQASSDYHASLQLLSPLLQPHSRRLADAYLRLGLALEFHPEASQQATASRYIESAANTLRKRLEALERRFEVLNKRGGSADSKEARAQAAAAELQEEKAKAESEEVAIAGTATNEKANGKSAAPTEDHADPAERDDVVDMDELRVDRELKDVREMVAELDAKLEDVKANAAATATSGFSFTSGQGGVGASGSSGSAEGIEGIEGASAKAALQQAINDAFLGASTNSLAPELSASTGKATGPINNLSATVRRKKRLAATDEATAADEADKGKEKQVETTDGASAQGKKVKVEDK